MSTLNKKIVESLSGLEQTVCTAESCTGGLIAASIVDVPGASKILAGGIVAYMNTAKANVLGVNADVIERETAVSEAVAVLMAEQARKKFGADWAVAVTGYAGESGIDKSLDGVVYISVAGADVLKCKKNIYNSDRNKARHLITEDALRMLYDVITETEE